MVCPEWVTFLTVLLGFLFQGYRESRNRKWDLQDRQRARQEQKELHAMETKQIKDAIDVNTAITSNVAEEIKKSNGGGSKQVY